MLGLREHDEAIAPLSLAELVFNKFFCKEISIVRRLKNKPGQAASPNDNHSHAVAQNEYKISKNAPAVNHCVLCHAALRAVPSQPCHRGAVGHGASAALPRGPRPWAVP